MLFQNPKADPWEAAKHIPRRDVDKRTPTWAVDEWVDGFVASIERLNKLARVQTAINRKK